MAHAKCNTTSHISTDLHPAEALHDIRVQHTQQVCPHVEEHPIQERQWYRGDLKRDDAHPIRQRDEGGREHVGKGQQLDEDALTRLLFRDTRPTLRLVTADIVEVTRALHPTVIRC